MRQTKRVQSYNENKYKPQPSNAASGIISGICKSIVIFLIGVGLFKQGWIAEAFSVFAICYIYFFFQLAGAGSKNEESIRYVSGRAWLKQQQTASLQQRQHSYVKRSVHNGAMLAAVIYDDSSSQNSSEHLNYDETLHDECGLFHTGLVNPATGLPMTECGIDVAGNLFGSSSSCSLSSLEDCSSLDIGFEDCSSLDSSFEDCSSLDIGFQDCASLDIDLPCDSIID